MTTTCTQSRAAQRVVEPAGARRYHLMAAGERTEHVGQHEDIQPRARSLDDPLIP